MSMRSLETGIAAVIASGVFNGSFTYPMKLAARWRWENIWLLFAFFGLLLMPAGVAFISVPTLGTVYSLSPPGAVASALGLGVIWGVGSLLFGLAVSALGISLGYAIVMGATAIFGTLVPALVLEPGLLFTLRGTLLVSSLVLIALGLGLFAVAGRDRERMQALGGSQARFLTPNRTAFGKSAAIAVVSGVFSACFNIGFALTTEIAKTAEKMGASPSISSFAIWALIMPAGFLPTLLYCLRALKRNGSFGLFREGAINWLYALVMGGAWILSVALYGAGAIWIGARGASIGWPVLMSVTVISANALGFAAGEWKGAPTRTRLNLSMGLAALLGAVYLAGLAGIGA
jgi:L-rhamnose-H+ transport protein